MQFQVGFGIGDITPDWPCNLQGYGNERTRISTGIRTSILVCCVAITDETGETALIMSMDAGGGGFEYYTRPLIEEKLGIPKDHIIYSALHQHSTPCGSWDYIHLVERGALAAAEKALADRAPATMYINKVQTKAMSFVRNYVCADGSFCGPNYGSFAAGVVGHESDADPELRLIKFEREGKKPVIMVNFQAHPHMGAGSQDTMIHGDWPALLRMTVAQEMDAHCIYLSGAGGNLNSTSYIKEENISADWLEHAYRAFQYVKGAEGSYQKAEAGKLKFETLTKACENNHSQDHLIEVARKIHELRQEDLDAARAEVRTQKAIHSIFHASAIVDQVAQGPTRDLTISAISFGDVAFTSHPYEMYDTNGAELRNGTVDNPNYEPHEQLENPYAMTFVCTLGNGHLGYIPSRLGYTNGGYSVDIAYLAPGAGERLVGEYLKILTRLHD